MNHHFFYKPCRLLLVFISLLFFKITTAAAIDSESDREKIVSAKSKKFYKSNVLSESFLIAGSYDSDQNSTQYHIESRYYYRSNRQMHELYFAHDSDHANSGTADGKNHLVKKAERYDGTISDKFMISQSNNYGVLYGRVDYDDLSSYYYDLRAAAGLGRIFFGDKMEFDTSIGYTDVKSYGSKVFIMPSVRINLRLTKNITFTQRGYFFFDHESVDNDLRTRLKYKISKKVSLAISHTFEQRRFGDNDDRQTVNQVRKFISFGLVFDLD